MNGPVDPLIGQEIDGYRIIEVLGRGGMGIVYKAEDVELARTVAIKTMDPGLASDKDFLRRFRSEARALARIHSPHIVQIHALRQTTSGLVIVMEYVDGGTIGDYMKDRMPWKQAIPMIKQMLTALSDAHSVGVVHRDIKPGNIMLTLNGTVKVTDFGLAKLVSGEVTRTATQGIAGSLYYMSPEQVRGHQDLDHRSDVYSLAMTIYKMLTGRLPFETGGGEFAIMRSIVEAPPVSPSRHVPDLPEKLVAIILHALEKDPAERYQSAGDMLAAVEEFEHSLSRELEAAPIVRQKDSPARPGSSESGTKKVIVLSSVGIIVLVLAALGIWWIGSSGNGTVDPPPEPPIDPPGSTLTIVTDPPGATVSIDGVSLGPSPIRNHKPLGEAAALRIELDGYAPLDTTVALQDGNWPRLNVRLTAQFARLVVTSNPSQADLWINNQRSGQTMYTADQLEPGYVNIRIQKSGYETWERRFQLRLGENDAIHADLVARQTRPDRDPDPDPPPPARATLVVNAVPGGVMAVDGKAASGSVSVTAGQAHTVTCGNLPFQASRRFTPSNSEQVSVTCYFRRNVNITLNGSNWATISVDGQDQEALAPGLITLQAGKSYRITVSRFGYTTQTPEMNLSLLPTFEQPADTSLVFEMKAQ